MSGRPAEAAFAEVSAQTRVARVPLAHLSIELGHLYIEDFAAGPDQLRRHFREVAPWVVAARRQLTDRLGVARPRVSTCFLIDDYFTRFSTPAELLPLVLEEAEKAGLVFGWVFAGHQLGAASAAFFAGAVRTGTESYYPAILLAGIFCLGAALLILTISKASTPRKAVPQAA